MKKRIVIVLLLLLLLCGCSYTEPDARYTVTALGFEQTTKGVRVVVRVIDAAKGEKGGEPDTFTLSAEGKDLREGFENLWASLSKKPSFGHCGILVFADNCDTVFIGEALALCEKNDLSKRTRLAVCNNVEGLLSDENLSTGEDFAELVDSAGEKYGIGRHSAFFEIQTATLLGEDFALPRFALSERVSLGGLLTFERGKPSERLSLSESAEYLKDK